MLPSYGVDASLQFDMYLIFIIFIFNMLINLYQIYFDFLTLLQVRGYSQWDTWYFVANCPAAFLSYFHCGFVMKYKDHNEQYKSAE